MFDHTFIDFDKTLFDCRSFESAIKEVFLKHGVSESDYEETYKQTIHTYNNDEYDYTFEEHVKFLRQRGCNIQAQELLPQLYSLSDNTKKWLFKDCYDLLKILKSRSHHLVLLSTGDKKFQMLKIERANLVHYFSDIVVIPGYKENYLSENIDSFNNSLFINDNLKENLIIKKKFPAIEVITKFDDIKYDENVMRESGLLYFKTLTGIKDYIEKK